MVFGKLLPEEGLWAHMGHSSLQLQFRTCTANNYTYLKNIRQFLLLSKGKPQRVVIFWQPQGFPEVFAQQISFCERTKFT